MANKTTQKKTSKKKPVKKKVVKNGRPSKKDKIDLKQLTILAEFGLTDKQISKTLGICEKTLNNYKKDKKVITALKKGKKVSDNKVIQSLYKRATGFKYTEVHREGDKVNKTIDKIVAPDTTACIYWLNNRVPDDWKNRKYIESKNENTNKNYDMNELTQKELDKELNKYGNIK